MIRAIVALLRSALIASLVGAAFVVAVPRAQQPFQGGVDLVRFPVVVSGKGGVPVHGLGIGDFEVLEDGQRQQIALFAEGAADAIAPLHVGLLLDTSSSMEQDLAAAETAAVRFVGALDQTEDVMFVDFNEDINIAHFDPASYPQLFERIRARKAGGETALYDAIAVYLDRVRREAGEHVLLVYSDGGDSISHMSFGDLDRMLKAGHVLVYTIGYMQNQARDSRTGQQMRMASIASETGGDSYFPQSAEEIKDIYAKILAEIESRYTLGYVSTHPARDGGWRKVQIRVTRLDLKGVKVRARPGYFASRPPA